MGVDPQPTLIGLPVRADLDGNGDAGGVEDGDRGGGELEGVDGGQEGGGP